MADPRDTDFAKLLSESYARLTKARLVPVERAGMAARWLYDEAPFCLLAHNLGPDPRFVYGNRAAQACFGYSWEELIGLPSRLSAEAPNRAERQALLERVASEGYATGYRGLRIAKSGRRFWIEEGTVWQVIDASGVHHGQAAMFSSWRDA